MSNRYSQWAPTEYVQMPVDYYQQALAVNDSGVQQKVDEGKQMLYALRSITPTGKNAEALQQQIMDEIGTQIEGVSKMNLKTPEALSKINTIISNPQYTSKLRSIYAMTEQAKKANDAYTKAVTDGNDRNALPYLQAMSSLADETGDPNAFNDRLFTGTDAIPKYVNVQEKLNDILGKIKASGKYQDQTTGQYIQIKSWEGVDKNAIRQAALSQLMANTDLKDQLQRNIKYDYFMQNHRDPNAALTQEADTMKQGIIDSYNNTKSILALGMKDKHALAQKYGIPKGYEDQFINKQKEFLNNTEKYYNMIQRNKDNPDALNQKLIMEKYVNNHVDASSDLLSYYTEKLDKKVNPYGLEGLKFQHELDLEDKRQAGRKEMLSLKAQMEYTRVADGTYAVDIGRSNNIGGEEMNDIDKQKLADGTWLNDIYEKNGIKSPIGGLYTSSDNAQDPTTLNLARKLGWDGTITNEDGGKTNINAVEYLKKAWMNQTIHPTGYINPKVDQGFIMASVLGAKSGLDVYNSNGGKITDEKEKTEIFNAFRKHTTDNKAGGTAAEMAIPLSTNPYNGKPALIYTDPEDASKISYIDLPKGIGARFSAASDIMNTERDLSYSRGKRVFVSGTSYQLARLPGQGNAGLFAFADADDRGIATEAQQKINFLAKEMMKKAGLSTARGLDSRFVKEAVDAINSTAQEYLKTGRRKNTFVVNGITLGVPFYVLNDFTNAQDASTLRDLRVGTLVPLGNGKGGVTDAKTLTGKIYHDGFKYLPAKGKAMDLEEAGTDKVKGSSYSLTNSIFGTDDDD